MTGEAAAPPAVVVMGVSGSGKSTIGALLAAAIGVPYVDADSLHPAANIEKMAAGLPLDDDDRGPWLELVGRTITEADATGIVVACSALRRAYRDLIRAHSPRTRFLHLDGSPEVLAARIEGRTGHFMPATLLASQLATLEPLGDDEQGEVVDIGRPVPEILADAVGRLSQPAR